MAGPVQTMSQVIRRFWAAVTGPSEPAGPAVVLHDPAAQRARDLDDPFFDDKVQTRIGDVIAGAGTADGNRKP
jgi:hypothetical protein